jgi:hypothetical protein
MQAPQQQPLTERDGVMSDVRPIVEQGIEYRECVFYEDYIAGSDGSIWKGFIDEPRCQWHQLSVRLNGPAPAVSVNTGREQTQRRVAELVLDAWQTEKVGPYIVYKDGNPKNCRPENLAWSAKRQNQRAIRSQKGRDLRRRIHVLHQSGDSVFDLASLFKLSVSVIEQILSEPYFSAHAST